MSEDWIAAEADLLTERLNNLLASRLTFVEEITQFGRAVAERVRRETLEEAERIVNAVADMADERKRRR